MEEELEDAPSPEFCDVCQRDLNTVGAETKWERCHVCGLVVCPNCDIRYKTPHKPACSKHA